MHLLPVSRFQLFSWVENSSATAAEFYKAFELVGGVIGCKYKVCVSDVSNFGKNVRSILELIDKGLVSIGVLAKK